MTREEQRRQAGRKYFNDYMEGLKGEVLTVEQTFEDAAKWADRTLIEKACKWMREEFYTSKDRDGHNILISASFDNVEELIKEFEKQIE